MIRTLLAALVLLSTLAVPAAANAGAGGDEPDPYGWKQYPCRTGGLDLSAIIAKAGDPGVTDVRLPGKVTCAPPEPGPVFAVAVFMPHVSYGTIYNYELTYPYASPTGPTTFTVTGKVRSDETYGLCLMSNETTRLSCVGVTDTWTGFHAVELPFDDPLVGRPVVFVKQQGPRPECATCWRVEP